MTRRDENDFFDYSWKHITFDQQLAEVYSLTKKGIKCASDCKFFYDIGYLRYLYETVDMVISPMSTVLLEGMIFGCPILAIAFNDQKHSWSADKVSRMYHFKEMYENQDIIVCRERDKIFIDIRRLCLNSDNIELCNRLKNFSEFFVTQKGSKYSQKLLFYIDSYFSRKDCNENNGEKIKKENNNYKTFKLLWFFIISYYKNISFSRSKR